MTRGKKLARVRPQVRTAGARGSRRGTAASLDGVLAARRKAGKKQLAVEVSVGASAALAARRVENGQSKEDVRGR